MWFVKVGDYSPFLEEKRRKTDSRVGPIFGHCNQNDVCDYDWQSRGLTGSTRKGPVRSKVGGLKKDKLDEGDLVVTHQFVVC